MGTAAETPAMREGSPPPVAALGAIGSRVS
jgi:hypothetical protein